MAQRVKEALARQGRTAEEIAAASIKKEQLKVAKARKRARKVEGAARVSKQRLTDKQKLAGEVTDLKADLEQHKEVLAGALAAKRRYTAIADKFDTIPSFQLERPEGAGRGALALPSHYRELIFKLLTLGAPDAAVGKMVTAVVTHTLPWVKPVEPSQPTLAYSRFELRTAEECISARRIAEAYAVHQLGLDQTTKFHVPSMVTSVQIEPTRGAPREILILRAAYGTGGATAQHEATAVEDKCFNRLRLELRGWEALCKRMFPKHVWTGPDPERCGLQRLGGGACIITDTCTTARRTQELLIKMVAAQVQAKVGPTAWAAMTEEEQAAAVRCHAVHCWQHIRNIFLAPMSAAASELLKHKLDGELDAFAAQERVSTSMGELLRADYKEFHQGCRYHKGAGAEFWEWAKTNHPSAFILPFERADGGRQDLDFDAAIPMFVNRTYMVEFLSHRVLAKGHSNILEDSIWITHTKLEYVAMIRACAVVDLRLARPLRWIAGNGTKMKDWSPFSMGPVLGKLEDLCIRGSRDGSVMLAEHLGIFEDIAAQQPAFRDHLDFMYEQQTVSSPDRKSKHLLYKLVLDELLHPQDADHVASRALTVEYLQAMCADGLSKLHDERTVIPKYLSSQDGELSWEKQAQGHEDTIGCELSNDKFAESVFGVFDRMLKRNEGISREGAAALTHAMRQKSFLTSGDCIKRRKTAEARRQPLEPPTPSAGYVASELPREERLALIEYSRITVRDWRKVDASEHSEHAAYVKAKVRTTAQEQLDALVIEFGYGLSFFQRWQEHGVQSIAALSAKLRKFESDHASDKQRAYQLQLDYLREQIEMRVRGLRMTHFKAQWGSSLDENVGTVEQLTGHLKEILMEERDLRTKGELPTSAPAPQMARKTFKELGTRTQQAAKFGEEQLELTPSQLREKAEEARQRLEAAGEIDSVEEMQPASHPAWDRLVGTELELLWRYWIHSEDGKKRGELCWCQGTVVEMSSNAMSLIPAKIRKELGEKPNFRAVRIRWPADPERKEPETFVWSILKPELWAASKHMGWRYAPCELAKLRAMGSRK